MRRKETVAKGNPDFSEPKEFAFGDLNPVQKRKTTPTVDPNSMSVLDALKEVVTAHYTPDATRGTGPYKGIVLRKEKEMDQNNPAPGNWLATVFGPQGMFEGLFTAPKKLTRYKVRIPEIHATLPTPAKYAQSPDESGDHQKIINMYPTFIAFDSNTEEAGPGDLVWVDFGNKENYEDPTYLGPVFPPPNSGGGGGGGGAGAKDAYGNCGGGAGIVTSSGGSINFVKPTLSKVALKKLENLKYKNSMYLDSPNPYPKSQQWKINKADPMWHVKGPPGGQLFKHIEAYVKAGGSGKAVTGKVAMGSCSGMKNELAKWLTAMRICVEDQADRGYQMGGKNIVPTKGGIDCSGFVRIVRKMAEFLIYPEGTLKPEGISGYMIKPEYPLWNGKLNKKPHYSYYSITSSPHYRYNSNTDLKPHNPKHVDGWDWFNVLGALKDGKDISDPSLYKDFLPRAKAGEFGPNSIKSIPITDFEEGQYHIMPGDEINHAYTGSKPSGPAPHGQGSLGLVHIMMVFADPEGNLRLTESGGPHTGTGSVPLEAYIAKIRKEKRRAYIIQKPEWSWLWAQVGGRPNEPWTPELCRKLAGDEYFSIPNLSAAATEGGTKTEVNNEDGTSTEKDTNSPNPDAGKEGKAEPPKEKETPEGGKDAPPAETPPPTPAPTPAGGATGEGEAKKPEPPAPPKPKITAENITLEQAKAAANSKAETEELEKLPRKVTSAEIAATAAGKRAIAKSLEEAKAEAAKSTPAANSTAAQNQSPAAAPAPVGIGSCSGGGYGGGGSGGGDSSYGAAAVSEYTAEGNRVGRAIGGMPNLAKYGDIKFRMKAIRVNKAGAPSFDKYQYKGAKEPKGMSNPKQRQDVINNFAEMRKICAELGCTIASVGGGRSLDQPATSPNASHTSFHYTYLAHDLMARSITKYPKEYDLQVCEYDPIDKTRFITWIKSSKTSGEVERNGVKFAVEHKTLIGAYRRGGMPKVEEVTGYFVNLTKIMNAYGMDRIGSTSNWRKGIGNGASEAWHFDFRLNGGLTPKKTTFGQVLGTMRTRQELVGKAVEPYLGRVFNGKSFSDIRLKKSINHIGSSPSGIPKYTFVYENDDKEIIYEGTIAQEIMNTHPNAVIMDSSGYYMVNYNLIDVDFKALKE